MKKLFLVLIALITLSNLNCSVYNTIVNVSRLKFKLGKVDNFLLNGVSISDKKKFEDFNPIELLKISSAIARGELPVSFTLNVDAVNPNDGTSGYPRTNITLRSFPWRLLINNKETINGNIQNELSVPGTGETTVIPLGINLDLIKFFKDKDLNSIVNLALNLGGYGGSSSNLALLAKPVLSSPLGNITYPDELKIVNIQYTK